MDGGREFSAVYFEMMLAPLPDTPDFLIEPLAFVQPAVPVLALTSGAGPY